MSEQLKVMISSTARDLPEHRTHVMDACLRQGMFPVMMEHLPASDAEAISTSLKMLDDTYVYLLVLAHRYGYVPKGHGISITEMEYNRAVERDIPRLAFLMDDNHPIKASDVETGDGAARLRALKDRVVVERVRDTFISPEDLRGKVIHALIPYRERDLTRFHYVGDIPKPPEEYVAHPYTLLQTHTLIGRQPELKLLTDWITGKELEFDGRKPAAGSVRIMSVIAIGGMGKSALTWKWFKDIAPEEMKPFAGRMWWSFYESDATFENFVTRALAYVTKRPLDEVQHIPAPERETALLAALDHEPFLIVFDGLERVLIAYAHMDASRLDDSKVGKEKGPRRTADPRVGGFLKKLAQLKRSRILVSSRLYPTELETDAGDPAPGTFSLKIEGLTDENAVELWRAFGASGSREDLQPVFATFGKLPLLIQALAGEVKTYRRAPGNFEEWRKANPRFNPSKFSELNKAMEHVLEFALRGLSDKARRTLHIVSAFRMPATYDTLTALLVGKSKIRFELSAGKLATREGKLFDEESDLDETLTELEDRGLLGWDRRANRYDLHPVVRRVVWSGLGDDTRLGVYTNLQAHFEALPRIDDYLKVNSLEDLSHSIELYNTLIGLRRYDDAADLFYGSLGKAMFYRLRANRHMVELLEMVFPDGPDQLPRLSRSDMQAFVVAVLGQGYHRSGQLGRATQLNRHSNALHTKLKDDRNLCVGLYNLAKMLQFVGALFESEAVVRRALVITRQEHDRFNEGNSLCLLGSALAARGIAKKSESAGQRALRIDRAQFNRQGEGVDNSYLAQSALRFDEFGPALSFANCAWELASVQDLEGDFIHAARLQGEAALGLNDLATADERLHHALTRARMVNLVDQELSTLITLADLRRRQGDLKAAREFLDDVWEMAERGPYPLIHADAFNVLAQIERDAGSNGAAIEAATKAYRLAWCDGPPFAYHWALEKAKKHLKELGAPEPDMPPFDESKFEPMPEVEIDPDDEFHAGGEAQP